ncbi:mCG1050119, partial [Mus musculus]
SRMSRSPSLCSGSVLARLLTRVFKCKSPQGCSDPSAAADSLVVSAEWTGLQLLIPAGVLLVDWNADNED